MGGSGENYHLQAAGVKMAARSAEAIWADICAVDLLQRENEHLVIEVNVSPGIQGLTKATGKDIAGEIAKYLFEQTKDWKKKR